MTNPSILPPDMQGVMSISGYRGVGKSFLASQADLPQNIAFFDFESKGAGINSQINFGFYKPLTQMSAGSPMTLYQQTRNAINTLEQDKFTVVVLDNISPMEIAFNAEAKANAKHYCSQFGLNLKNVTNNRFGGTKSIVNFMISDMCSELHSKGVKLIIAIAHISKRWVGGQPLPNKFNIKGADRWQNLSILTLVLIPGTQPPVPDALVQKEQLGIINIPSNPSPEQIEQMLKGEAGHEVKRRLPLRIPQCSFQKIRWYLNNPADISNPGEGEIPSFAESDPFKEALTREQFSFAQSVMLMDEKEEKEDKDAFVMMQEVEADKKADGIVDNIRDIPDAKTLAPPQVLAKLKEKGIDTDIPTVVQALSKIN